MLDDIKLLLGISKEDESTDSLLNTLISLKSQRLKLALSSEVIPLSLEYIIIELVIAHYNKLGSEGLAAESVEGISRTYSNDGVDELTPYREAIDIFLGKSSGKFRFY